MTDTNIVSKISIENIECLHFGAQNGSGEEVSNDPNFAQERKEKDILSVEPPNEPKRAIAANFLPKGKKQMKCDTFEHISCSFVHVHQEEEEAEDDIETYYRPRTYSDNGLIEIIGPQRIARTSKRPNMTIIN